MQSIAKIEIEEIRKKTDQLLAELEHHKRVVREEKNKLFEARQHAEDVEKARQIAQQVAQTIQQQVHVHVAAIVNRCLEAIYDDPYEFRIIFDQKRGKTEARFAFFRDDYEIDPMRAAGGGIVDVASFALRLSAVLLSRPKLRRLLVLDEPFRFVFHENRLRLRALLESLSKEMDFQFLIVTHISDFQIGNVIDLGEGP